MALELGDEDKQVAKAYELMAQHNGHIWSKFAKEELDAILPLLSVPAHAKIIDLGCGSGRHAIELARRGYKVRAFDYVSAWIHRANKLKDQFAVDIESAQGAVEFELGDARNPNAVEAANAVLCLYDVVGSSASFQDAIAIIHAMFRLCLPGGTAVIGCMNGMKMIRALPAKVVFEEPLKEELLPLTAMQDSGEVFDFGKMAYNPRTGVLYRREQFLENGKVVNDTLLKERRYIPSEIFQIMQDAGFKDIKCYSVRAGKWEFGKPFDADAPEVLYVAKRPKDVAASIPRLLKSSTGTYRGYTLDLIPKAAITPVHAHIVSRIFCTSFGQNPKTGAMKVLGPKRMWERLMRCSHLCILSCDETPVGYMFGTEYSHLLTKIAWLDSICVVKEQRRKGYATAMIDAFARAVPDFEWLGATSPNPVTPLIF